MRFMVQVRADKDTEAGKMPTRELVAAMGKFNADMINAGIMQAGEGLHPSSRGVRISFAGGSPKVIAPPFAEPNELICGFWILEVPSLEAAIDWMKRAPFGDGGVLEIRKIFEASDFPPEVLPEEEAAREQAFRDAQREKTAPRR